MVDSMAIDFFNSIDHLEPKCSNCQTKINYGVTTRFDEKLNQHVCINCGNVV